MKYLAIIHVDGKHILRHTQMCISKQKYHNHVCIFQKMREVFDRSIRRTSNLQQIAIFVTNGRPTVPGDQVTALAEALKEATAAKVNDGVKIFTVSYTFNTAPSVLNFLRSSASAPQYLYSAARVADLQSQISSRLATDVCRVRDVSTPTTASTSTHRPPSSTTSPVTVRTTTLSGSSELLTNRTDGDYKINLCIKKGALCFTVPPSQGGGGGGGRGPAGATGPSGRPGERGKYTLR